MQPNHQPILQAIFIIPPKVHLLDITGPAHIFYEASCYGAPVTLTFSTIDQRQTESVSSSFLAFHQLIPYSALALKPGDLVFVPGLEADLLFADHFTETTRAFQYWWEQN